MKKLASMRRSAVVVVLLAGIGPLTSCKPREMPANEPATEAQEAPAPRPGSVEASGGAEKSGGECGCKHGEGAEAHECPHAKAEGGGECGCKHGEGAEAHECPHSAAASTPAQ